MSTEQGTETRGPAPQPLRGIKVVDIATLFAGPLAATLLGDYGADVIKVEHPRLGDAARVHGETKNGIGLWWKMLARNKRPITLYLGAPEGRDLFLRLIRDVDVVVESFRPGTLERWGLGWDVLVDANPRLVLARVSGFGQTGPFASRPGYGTLAEAMSGFAHITGQPDGPPTLPPFGLADGVAAVTTAFAILTALRGRDITGVGQQVDVALIEPLLTVLGPQATVYDQLGIIQQRTGNRTASNAPRNTYLSADGVWLAVSASSLTIAERVMRLVGRPDLCEHEWFRSGFERAKHGDEIDAAVGAWIAERAADKVIEEFEQAQAAIAPVLDIAGIMSHPQYQALGSIVHVDDDELGGPVAMQNLIARMSATPGAIRWTGRPRGSANAEIYGALGLSPEELSMLAAKGVV
ncbi:CaiB/BaiF CoA transferase family protein [Plantactinospora sp. GCM10030261]|uniref:CaiB/BaiF CoA transferase family protein n=1 Tax=Plantactinospora sp. GCM10030261 TaxID=3273420 RepID=UPI0036119842